MDGLRTNTERVQKAMRNHALGYDTSREEAAVLIEEIKRLRTLSYTGSREEVTVLVEEIKRLRKKNRLRRTEIRKLRRIFWTAARFEKAVVKHWFVPDSQERKEVLAQRHRELADAFGPEFARMASLFDPLYKLEEEYQNDLERTFETLRIQQL